MTNQQIIEVLAEREGWTDVRFSSNPYYEVIGNPPKNWHGNSHVPSYLSSLDALQPVLATLTEEEIMRLREEVERSMEPRYLRDSIYYFRQFVTIKPHQLATCIARVVAAKIMKYRKKPVVIEAVQYFNDMGTKTATIPVWLIEATINGTIFARGKDTFIKTLEGEYKVSDGDFIIQGVKGELYPCKPDIFEQTYEQVL